jgi:hypothetical protein
MPSIDVEEGEKPKRGEEVVRLLAVPTQLL